MTTVTFTANEIQLKLLFDFCNKNGIGFDIKDTAPNVQADTTFRTPSAALKQFCGPEMMTTKGKMKPSSAAEFIMSYAKRNNLLYTTMISMDDNLREVFQQNEGIPCTELPRLVNSLFSD